MILHRLLQLFFLRHVLVSSQTPTCVSTEAGLLAAIQSAGSASPKVVTMCAGRIKPLKSFNLSNKNIDLRCQTTGCVLDGTLSKSLFFGDYTTLASTGIAFSLATNPGVDGAAFRFFRSAINLTRCSFNKNNVGSTGDGGAIHLRSSTLTLNGPILFDGNLGGVGGAILLSNTTLTGIIGNITFANNQAGKGVAISAAAGSRVNLKGVTFVGNKGNGSTVELTSSTANFDSVVFRKNNMTDGAFLLTSSTASLAGVKFIENIGTSKGAGLRADRSKVTLTSCIFAKNTLTTGSGADLSIADDINPRSGGSLVTCVNNTITAKNLFCNGLSSPQRIYEGATTAFVNTDCLTNGKAGVIGGGGCNV